MRVAGDDRRANIEGQQRLKNNNNRSLDAEFRKGLP